MALGLSAMIFLGMVTPAIDIRFWQKLLYKKEEPKDKIKKDYKIGIVIWAILTIALFIYVAFFVE
jgi:hypothetical protein